MIFKSAFKNIEDGSNGQGIRPVIFDIVAPDRETSLLPDNLKLVLHVNPDSMSFSYTKNVQEIQTKGGYVEQHWGDQPSNITINGSTGGFMRLYAGRMPTASGSGIDMGGSRRETIAYDKFLDLLALFHNNGAIYNSDGRILFHGFIKVSFDGQSHLGYMNNFQYNESTDKPVFTYTIDFQVAEESWMFRKWQGKI